MPEKYVPVLSRQFPKDEGHEFAQEKESPSVQDDGWKRSTPDLVINKSQITEDKEPKTFQKYKKKFCFLFSALLQQLEGELECQLL